MTRILLIDNYDSFTYNIAQELGERGADVTVTRHDAFVLEDVATDRPDGIVISPGPGTPDDAGLSMDVIRRFAGDNSFSRSIRALSSTSRFEIRS